jgi:hypothetical protein
VSGPKLGHPRPDAAEALGRDSQHDARGRIVHRRELHAGTEVDVGKPLEQLRCAAFLHSRAAVNDQVLPKPGRMDRSPLDRQHDPRVAGHVAQLLLGRAQVAGDDLGALQSDPDAAHLWTAVAVDRREVTECIGLEQGARARRENHAAMLRE